ncbi:MAG TPA: hypothetical protein VFU02_21905, partial [Polyangiaceae bacterium]|nr:hypothetical protein [Polyangiaceae bacterium]
ASYASVVYRVAMLELPEFPDLYGADSPANTWLTLPFTTDDGRVSAFAFALAVGLIGTLLALVVQRLPARFATGAVHVAAAAVKLLVLLGLVTLVIAANRPALVNPVSLTRHVYDWAVVVGSLGVMLAFGDRTCSTPWFATALGAVVAVRATEHVRSPMWWSYPSVWHEVIGAILLCAVPLGLAVGLAASRLSPRTGQRHPLRCIAGGSLALACALLSLDGFTWYAPSLPNKKLSHTTHCLEDVPGRAYRFPSGGGSRADVGDWRLSRYNTPQLERITHAVLYAALDEPAADYLPVLAEIAKDDLPLYVYASYLESIDLFTLSPFYVSNSSCAIASAPLGRLQKEQPPASVHTVRQLLEWLRKA